MSPLAAGQGRLSHAGNFYEDNMFFFFLSLTATLKIRCPKTSISNKLLLFSPQRLIPIKHQANVTAEPINALHLSLNHNHIEGQNDTNNVQIDEQHNRLETFGTRFSSDQNTMKKQQQLDAGHLEDTEK